jgi:CubicO group peptidase (beta-lactamase class C family)
VDALRQVDDWPVESAAVCVIGAREGSRGELNRAYEWASVTKLATALAALVAAE